MMHGSQVSPYLISPSLRGSKAALITGLFAGFLQEQHSSLVYYCVTKRYTKKEHTVPKIQNLYMYRDGSVRARQVIKRLHKLHPSQLYTSYNIPTYSLLHIDVPSTLVTKMYTQMGLLV